MDSGFARCLLDFCHETASPGSPVRGAREPQRVHASPGGRRLARGSRQELGRSQELRAGQGGAVAGTGRGAMLRAAPGSRSSPGRHTGVLPAYRMEAPGPGTAPPPPPPERGPAGAGLARSAPSGLRRGDPPGRAAPSRAVLSWPGY